MSVLPWRPGTRPLMLAPMQGLTNGALRQAYMEHYQPDVVFTEFVRVSAQSRKGIAKRDLADIAEHDSCIPLVVQLIGNSQQVLCDAARQMEERGCSFLNLNLGCPYGRMTTGATGGELLKDPQALASMLTELRKAIRTSFSIKCRSGYEDPRQILELLPLFEDCGVDFLILHPRTVVQKYAGSADHRLTAEVAGKRRLPVIANGDINTAGTANALLAESSVAGLMLGRGALADPLLFRRIRGDLPALVDEGQRRRELYLFIADLLKRYEVRFCGERQALMKLKDVLNFIPDVFLQRDLNKLKRCVTVNKFISLLGETFLTE